MTDYTVIRVKTTGSERDAIKYKTNGIEKGGFVERAPNAQVRGSTGGQSGNWFAGAVQQPEPSGVTVESR